MKLIDLERTVFSASGRVSKESQIQKLFDIIDIDAAYKILKDVVFDFSKDNILTEDVKEKLGIKGKHFSEMIGIQELKTKMIDFSRQLMDVNIEYLWCPHCKKFHKMHTYIAPKDGWENLLKKYSLSLFYLYLTEYLLNSHFRYEYCLEQMIAVRSVDDDYIEVGTDIGRIRRELTNFNVPYSDFERNDNGIIWKCPDCGTKFGTVLSKSNPLKFDAKNGWHSIFLYRDSTWKEHNLIPISYDIFDNKDDLVTYSKIEWLIYPNIHGRLHVKHLNVRLTFNTKTGQTYKFRVIDLTTKKAFSDNDPRITCATYSPYVYMHLENEAAQELADKICEKKGIKKININDKNPLPYFSRLRMLNRFGHTSEQFFKGMEKIFDNSNMSTRSKTKLYKMTKDTEEFALQLKKNKVSGKRRRRMYAENPMLFVYEPILKRIGFKDNNVLLTLMENEDILERILDKVCKRIGFSQHEYNEYTDSFKTFIEEYSRLKGEAELAKKMIADKKEFFFGDVVQMYIRLVQRVNMTDNDKRHILSGTMKEMHDRLSELIRKTKEIPYYIPYTSKDIKFNCKCGDYTFELAKTNMELKDVGEEMHICVGSYGNSAAAKHCLIVFMKKEGNINACIELSGDGKKLKQAKDFCNNTIKYEKREALATFLNKNKIQSNDCWDFERAELDKCQGNEPYSKITNTDGYMVFNSLAECKPITIGENITISGLELQMNRDYEQQIRQQVPAFNGDWMQIPDDDGYDLPFN